MKTKLTLSLFTIFILHTTLSAQIWYDDNATWYRYGFNVTSASNSISKVSIEKDTILNGIQVKKLIFQFNKRHGITGELTETTGVVGYEYERNDSVFHWSDGQFNLVYNFNLLARDTIRYDVHLEEPVQIILDSVITQNISNHPRRVQYFRTLPFIGDYDFCQFPEEYIIVEGIGSLGSRNPMYDFLCALDVGLTSLRCFSDSFIDYNPGNYICNEIDWIVPTEEISTKLAIQVYPNPTSNHLLLRGIPNQSLKTISIYDLNGQKIRQVKNSAKIDVQYIAKGIYFLEINLGKQIISKKFIKH